MPADYGLTIDKLINHNKLQNKMISSQIDELTLIRSKLATVEHDAKITRYISVSFAALFMACLVSVGLTA
jgi:hypothetical protein